MDNVIYKLASEEDLENMIQVGDQLFDHEIKPDRATEFLTVPRHHLVLAYFKGKVIGMASGFHYVHPDKDPFLFINEVGVIEPYQGRGIGRKLVKLLCDHGLKIGCREAWIGTEESNVPARKSYQAAGGREDKEPFILIEFDLLSD